MKVGWRLLCGVSPCALVAGTVWASSIGEALRPLAESGRVPGICTAVCDARGRVTVDCVGYANIAKRTPITEETRFWVASDTKGLAGALVLTFVQEGKIDLDAPVERYFPSWSTLYVRETGKDGAPGARRPARTKPTVRNLISHTAGLAFLPGGPIDTRSMSLMANLVPTRDLICEPNTKYSYSNWGIDCAVAIVELVSGRPWEVSLQERILDPLGMASATFWPPEDDAPGSTLAAAYDMDPKSKNYRKAVKTVNMRHPYTNPRRYAEAGGGLFMTTRDYMKFCQMILAGGRADDGRVILTPESMRLLTTKQTPPCEKTSYGFGFFWKPETGELSHGGAFNTGFSINVSNRTAHVFHWQAPGGDEATRQAFSTFVRAKRAFLAAASVPTGIRPFAKGERVAFLGDSITAFNHYIAELQLYMDAKRGADAPYFMNCGTAGDGAHGAQDRIACDLMTMRPDRVIVMLGMNDNAYDTWKANPPPPAQLAAHARRREGFAAAMRALVEKLLAKGLKVDLMTPTPYDEYATDLKRPPYPGANEIGLAAFAEDCRRLAAEKGLGLVELHRPMTALEKAHPAGLRYSGADRVHPGPSGNRFMAAAILAAAGEIPETALTTNGVEALFAADPKMPRLRAVLEPVRKEMERLRALVYCDRFVKGLTGREVDLADIAPAAAAVGTWVDAELARGTDPARAKRLREIRDTYATARVQVPELQRKLEVLHRGLVAKAGAADGDAAYGNYGAVERLKTVPVDAVLGDADAPMPVATGAGEIVVRPPREKAGVVKAADYGLSATNEDNGAAIQRALDAAKAAGVGRLVLAPGVYRCYGPKGIVIDGFEDFTFDGAGAELVFRRAPTAPIVPSWNHDSSRANFVIRNCRRTSLGNFDMDWDWRTAPLATGAIVRRVKVDPARDLASFVEFELVGHGDRHPYWGQTLPVQYLIPMTPDFRRFGVRETWWMGTYEGDMGAKSEWIDPTHVRVYPSVFDKTQPHWGGPNAVGGNAKENRRLAGRLKPGDTVRISHRYYGKGGFTLDSNADFALHDVNVYACFGFGVYVDGSQRNWTLRNVRFRPRDFRHPISCSADTIHFSHSEGGAVIDGFQASHGQDDAINVHDRFTVAKPDGARELSIVLRRGAVYFTPGVGHEVELLRPTFHPTGWRGKVVSVSDRRIAFDRPVPRDAPYFLVLDRSASCDRVIFRNAMLEDGEQRTLFNASDVTIENCLFRRSNGDALRLLADYTMTYWCEGTGVTNLVVRNCRFEDNCRGRQRDCPWNMGADLVTCLGLPPDVKLADADKRHVSRILVEDCVFRDSLSYAAAFNFGRDILFRRNRIETTGARADRLPASGSIRLRHVANVRFEDNSFAIPAGAPRPSLEIGEDVTDLVSRGNAVRFASDRGF